MKFIIVPGASPSNAFVYIGAGAPLPADARRQKSHLRNQGPFESPMVKFEHPQRGSTPNDIAESEGARGARYGIFLIFFYIYF